MDEWSSVGDFGGGTGGTDFSAPTDYGSFDTSSYDLGGGSFDTSGINGGMTGFSPQLQDPSAGMGMGSAAPGAGPNQGSPFGGLGLQGLLGLGGAGASLIGALMGGGVTGTAQPQMGTAQKALGNQASNLLQQGPLSQFAQGQNPLQMQQASLLQALAGGQGLPPGYQQLIEQAFQPQLGSLYQQAAQQGQQRGFYDAPATSPAGGAVLGPGLADLQGQMAQAKLQMMMSMPGVFQPAINSQGGFAQGQAQGTTNLFSQYPYGQQNTGNLPQQVGQGVGNMLLGIGGAMGGQAPQTPQNPQSPTNPMTLPGPRPITLSGSGTTGY
jgi:hypothetical protein